MNDIGKKLKYIREQYALSQVAFAKRLGITNAHVSKIEKGKTMPSEALLRLICKEFRVNKYWLLNSTGPIFTDDIEENVDHLMETSIERGNKTLRSDNALLRAQYAQLYSLFTQITEGDFPSEDENIAYLKELEKIFYDLHTMLELLKEQYYGTNYTFFDYQELSDILVDRKAGIMNDIDRLWSFISQVPKR